MSDNLLVKDFTISTKDYIGQGTHGVVYRALDPKGNEVAAKRVDLAGRSFPNIIKDVEKLKELDHPNIVKVYDIHQDDNVVWIFMELCDHGDLNKFYRKSELKHEESFEIIRQIGAGVKYLHQQDVVHRDIKPENILVSNNSPIHIKLTDFDVSKFLKNLKHQP